MTVKRVIAATVTGAALMLASPLLEEVEGVRYKPYRDIAGVLTVCHGITGKDVIQGKEYTKRECDALLAKHMRVAANAVDSSVKVDIPVSMRAAMYSFTFNAGVGAFKKSTMLKKINNGDLVGGCEELFKWVYFRDVKTGKMKQSKGLKNRRSVEYKYCMKELKK